MLMILDGWTQDTALTDSVFTVTEPKRPQELKLPAEILYWTSACTGLSDVKSKFRALLQSLIRQEDTCQLSPGDCLVEDLLIECPINDYNRRFRRRYLSHRSQHGRHLVVPARSTRTERDNPNIQKLSIQFHFATRIPDSGGSWPEEYHKASQRLFKMFEYFEEKVMSEMFNLGNKVTVLELLEEDKDSLTLTDKIAICDISYTFREAILMCGELEYTHFSGSQCCSRLPLTYQRVDNVLYIIYRGTAI